MTEKKFYIAGIVVPAVCLLAVDIFLGSIILSVVTGIIGLLMNLKKRKTHRTAIGIVLSVLLLLAAVTTTGIMVFDLSTQGEAYRQDGVLTQMVLQYLLGIPFGN